MINIKNWFKLNKNRQIKLNKQNIDIYNIKYITIKDLDYKNPLYLIFNKINGYTEENNENKYLIFASTVKGKIVLTKYTECITILKILVINLNYMFVMDVIIYQCIFSISLALKKR